MAQLGLESLAQLGLESLAQLPVECLAQLHLESLAHFGLEYAHSQALLQDLQRQDAAGDCELWYFDGSGFCLEPCLP